MQKKNHLTFKQQELKCPTENNSSDSDCSIYYDAQVQKNLKNLNKVVFDTNIDQAPDLQGSSGGELVTISCSSLPNVNNINSISNRTILKEYKSKLRFSHNLSKLHIHSNKRKNSLDKNFVNNPDLDKRISADKS